MSSPHAKHLHTARWIRPERLAGSPEWTVGLRRHLTAVWFAAAGLILCILLPAAGFPALYVAAIACGGFYHDCEPLRMLQLPEMNASRLLVRKVLTAWRNYFLLAIPFALLGLVIIVLFFSSAKEHNDRAFRWMWLTIVLSFGFYIPVVLWADTVPVIGMLMIPKTCAYVWTVVIGWRAMKAEA